MVGRVAVLPYLDQFASALVGRASEQLKNFAGMFVVVGAEVHLDAS